LFDEEVNALIADSPPKSTGNESKYFSNFRAQGTDAKKDNKHMSSRHTPPKTSNIKGETRSITFSYRVYNGKQT